MMIKSDWRASTKQLARDAWWYATGRCDAGDPINDVNAFAHSYGSMDHDMLNELVSFRPSIQDAYTAWREQHP